MNRSKTQESSRFIRADAQGPRDEQQDAAVCLYAPLHETALLLVSDGLGGNSGGRLASQAVVDAATALWKERNGIFDDPLVDLDALCRFAHREMNRLGAKQGLSPRATVVALHITPSKAFWVHSGDSRLYHFRAGRLVKRTQDHSVVQVMVRHGMLKEDQMGSHPAQGTLLQSLGGEDYKAPTRDATNLTANDAFLLCTDGFWERTKLEEMSALLFGSTSSAAGRLQQAVERAVIRNGPKGDNVTVVVALPAMETAGGGGRRVHRRILVLAGVFFLLALTAFCLGSLFALRHHRQKHQIAVGTPATTLPAAPPAAPPQQISSKPVESPISNPNAELLTPRPASPPPEEATRYREIKSISIDGTILDRDH